MKSKAKKKNEPTVLPYLIPADGVIYMNSNTLVTCPNCMTAFILDEDSVEIECTEEAGGGYYYATPIVVCKHCGFKSDFVYGFEEIIVDGKK